LRPKAGNWQGYSFKAAAVLPPRAGITDVPPFIHCQAGQKVLTFPAKIPMKRH
jgi:hypothetical protein